ncbi:MAG: AraC family transcriptional regulator [Bacteroidaceae bacterium]|nr:AraC family transcriptional regulator [Bacteroidaceae bacterium]
MSIPKIIKVDLSHFPTDERFAQIPGKLVLADNLDGEKFSNEGHNHPDFPVQVTMAVSFICIKGKMDMNIDLHHYTLTDGDTAMVFPGCFFQMGHIQEGTKCLFMAISPDFITYIGDVKLGIEFGRKLKENPIHKPTPEELEEHLTIYHELKRKLLDKEYCFKEEVARSYLRVMQCNVFQKFMKEKGVESDIKPANRKEELFMKFIAMVKEHYMENRCISFYADKMFVSPKYLSSVVHEVSGTYATDWINQHVILEAKTMLREKGVVIKDVSNKLNFANQSFFAKYFKQHTGYTPKEYKAL